MPSAVSRRVTYRRSRSSFGRMPASWRWIIAYFVQMTSSCAAVLSVASSSSISSFPGVATRVSARTFE